MSALTVLALNSGSSSLKLGAYRVDADSAERLLGSDVEFDDDDDAPHQRAQTLQGIADLVAAGRLPAPDVIGHRVVHGGPALREHCVIDEAVLAKLMAVAPLAPLHTALALAVIRLAQTHFPRTPQVACFDTSFHATMPDVARTLPLPKVLRQEGIQRYGFHGLSAASVVRQLGPTPPSRLLIAHLGNGASITAVRDGVSIDTSMGFTPTGGVPMGTRSGDLDPGVLLHLMRHHHYDMSMLAELVDHRAGLLGVSGIASDMRSLHAAAGAHPDADLAIRLFCYAVRKAIGAMAAALDGVDTLVFTGGIGEHDWRVRADICSGLGSLGIELDAVRNRAAHDPISSDSSRVRALVRPADEEAQIAHHAWALLTRPRAARAS